MHVSDTGKAFSSGLLNMPLISSLPYWLNSCNYNVIWNWRKKPERLVFALTNILLASLYRSSRWPESWIFHVVSGFIWATGCYNFSATFYDSKVYSEMGRVFWWGNTIYVRFSRNNSHVFKERLLATCLWFSDTCEYILSVVIYVLVWVLIFQYFNYVYIHVCVCVCMYIYIYICVCVCVCMYVCVYIYIYTHTHTYTHTS